ncbi:flagellin [Bacillus cereus]|uniref:flagellin N-terminal helical domain-containing protein n=1 Tax=Bacillus cereus TaxID=1396 RepID=UPI003079EF9D
MRINTNTVSLNTQNLLRKSSQGLEKGMERLSSGKRINNASDDAAGLAIATRMDSKIRGMDVGIRNSNDGISAAQTAEGALGSITNILQRMRDLAVQSSNGTNNTDDSAALDKEYGQLKEEIDHIANNTTFNGVNLLNAAGKVSIQLSDVKDDTMDISTIDAKAATLTVATGITTAADAGKAMDEIDAALKTVSTARADYGANLNRLNFNIDNISSSKNNLAAAKSRIEDADMAAEVSEMTKNRILTQTGMAMLSQANQNPQQVMQLIQ